NTSSLVSIVAARPQTPVHGVRKWLHCRNEQRCNRAARNQDRVPGERQRRIERCRISAEPGNSGGVRAARCSHATARGGTNTRNGSHTGRGAAATLLTL